MFDLGVERIGDGHAPVELASRGLEVQARPGAGMIAVVLFVTIEGDGVGEVSRVRGGEVEGEPDVLRAEVVEHVGILEHADGGRVMVFVAVVVVLHEMGDGLDVIGGQFAGEHGLDFFRSGNGVVGAVLGAVVEEPPAEEHVLADVDIFIDLSREVDGQPSDGPAVPQDETRLAPLMGVEVAEGIAGDLDDAVWVHAPIIPAGAREERPNHVGGVSILPVEQGGKRKDRIMRRRTWITVAVIIGVLVILFVTNPSEDKHKDAIRERQSSIVGTGAVIAADALGAYQYNNYGVFSTVTSGEDVISFGIIGGVFVDEDDR